MNRNAKKLFLFSLITLGLLFFGSPEKTYAFAFCDDPTLQPAGIQIDIAGGPSFTATGDPAGGVDPNATYSISVPSGTVIDFSVYTFAEPSSFNSINYPKSSGGSFGYPGPQGYTGPRTYSSDPITTGGHTIQVQLTQNCQTPFPPNGWDPYVVTMTININLTAPPVCAIDSIYADDMTPSYNTGTTIHFSFTGVSFPWTISLVGANTSPTPSPTSGTASADSSDTGNLTDYTNGYLYEVNCNSGDDIQQIWITPDPPPAPPTTVTLTASPTSMTLPTNSTTLSWSTSGSPTSCDATGDWSGSKNTAGSSQIISGLAAGTYTYTLTCNGPGGTSADTEVVVVNPAVGCVTDCSAYVSHKINGVVNPASITLYSGQSYSAEVVMQNTGTNAWIGSGNPKYRLGPKLANTVYSTTINVPGGGVAASASRTFDTSFVAPAVGTYSYKWGMLNNSSSNNTPTSPAFFGASSPDVTVSVVPPPPTTPTGLGQSCQTVSGNEQVTLSWTDQVWESNYIVQISGFAPVTLGANTISYGPTTVVTNQNYTWTVQATNSTAPSGIASGSFKCPDLFWVTVANPITGGLVRSTSPNTAINCGAACSAQYLNGSTVILEAVPSSSYWKFNGWAGDCTGFGICSLLVTAAKNVSVSFGIRLFNYSEF